MPGGGPIGGGAPWGGPAVIDIGDSAGVGGNPPGDGAVTAIGTWLAGALGISTNTPGVDWLELLVQVVVAAIGVVIAANLWARRGVHGRRSY